ncbi:hypothetical protein [Roseomonas harenae]|uniref:hypothetical protein n=1 Tax=Muricoccus harenae TaxID=2692566 RepID=UPI001331B5A3|nr:hypothetical protein [Roseomonas harenae]
MTPYPPILMLTAALLLSVLSSPPTAQEPSREELTWAEPVWIEPVSIEPFAGTESSSAPGIIEQPAGWAPGDAVVIVLPGHTAPDAARERLIARLLNEGAAVLVLYAPRGHAADTSFLHGNARKPPAELLAPLFGALLTVRRDYGAGVVVVLANSTALVDEVALRATSETIAAEYLGATGPRFTAAGALGSPGRAAAFRLGAAPPSIERWPSRVPRLCAILGDVAADLAEVQPHQVAASTAERDCSEALLRPGHSVAAEGPG